MKNLITLIAFIILTNPVKMNTQTRIPKSKIETAEKKEIQNNVIRNPLKKDDNTRPIIKSRNSDYLENSRENIFKRQTEMPPIKRYPAKSKKPTEAEKTLEICIFQDIYVEENNIESTTYCDYNPDPDKNIIISQYPYPDFPLRFVKASIDYQYTALSEDIYELFFIVAATYNNFNNEFGILLTNDEKLEKVIFFNDEREFMYYGENYLFKKLLKLKNKGYVNLRLGYFDNEENIFYPEEFVTNKTDKLIYIEKEEEVTLDQF